MIEFIKVAPLELRSASGQINDIKTVTRGQSIWATNTGGKFYLTVTTQTGTSPTLNVFIVKVIDGVQHILGQFTQVTTVLGASTPINISNLPDDIQVAWVIGGTGSPAYTFSVWMTR